jgi:hypothetical protein
MGRNTSSRLDSDAHPIRSCWLTHLISALDTETALAGIWRDEISAGIAAFVHPSCFCTTVEFVEANSLRFDSTIHHTDRRSDTLSDFTDKVGELGFGIHKLRRSNWNEFHRLIGGIYGDLIYHHGAGSRAQRIVFWDERPRNGPSRAARRQEVHSANRDLRDKAAALLFRDYERYIGWLRGQLCLG